MTTMTKLKKPGFRREPKETGLRAIGNSKQSVTIKMGRDGAVGRIFAPNWQSNAYTVGLMVKKTAEELTNKPNCDWRWVLIKFQFENEESARAWVCTNWKMLNEKYTLYIAQEAAS